MIVVLPDGKFFNLDLVCFTDTRGFTEPVRFSMVNGESIFAEISEAQYQSMLLAYLHKDAVHKVLPIKETPKHSKLDLSDFPSVLEGENSAL